MRNTAELAGARVLGGKNGRRRIGKVWRAVFYPEDFRLAGYVIKRPDVLWMFKRKDRFLAFDRYRIVDGRVVASDARDSWDARACARLGLDWDTALVLQGMPVTDADQVKVGTVDALEYEEHTGRCTQLLLSSSLGAKALVGQTKLPLTAVAGYRNNGLALKEGIIVGEPEGGLAAKAGAQAAVISHRISQTTQTAGAAVGKQLGKTKGMFKAFRDEYKKAAKGHSAKE